MALRLKRTLLQVAAVVFLLNTSLSYGACCVADISDELGQRVAELPPCHKTVSEDDSAFETSAGSCCITCVPALPMMAFVAAELTQSISFPLSFNTPSRASEVAQPFRPPIFA